MKRLLISVCMLVLTTGLWAAEKSEVSLSASAFNPADGPTVWSGTAEFLFPIGPLVVGPSVSLFDLGDTDGGWFGVAGEFNLTGKAGLFVGGSVNKPTGDAADQADYTAQARAGVKFGSGKGFVKVYASQTWSQLADGSRVDPDGTAFNAGLGLRF